MLAPLYFGVWIALLATPYPARAATPLARGAHIRWVQEAGPLTPMAGWVVRIRSDAVTAEDDRAMLEHTLPFATLKSLEIAQSRTSRAPRYALIGAPAGGAIGVIGAQLVVSLSEQAIKETTGFDVSSGGTKSKDTAYVQVALVGAGVGALVGAVVGSARRGPETWERVELGDSPVGVIFRTGADHALGVNVRF